MKTKILTGVLMGAVLGLGTGCAGTAVYKAPEELTFIKASEGGVGGFYGLFRGDAAYCMAELHRIDQATVVAMELKGNECYVKLLLQGSEEWADD